MVYKIQIYSDRTTATFVTKEYTEYGKWLYFEDVDGNKININRELVIYYTIEKI